MRMSLTLKGVLKRLPERRQYLILLMHGSAEVSSESRLP